MKDKLPPLTKTTLKIIMAQFPTHEWCNTDLEELISPKYGVISGFQKINEDTLKLFETDLKEIEPAGNVLFTGKNNDYR